MRSRNDSVYAPQWVLLIAMYWSLQTHRKALPPIRLQFEFRLAHVPGMQKSPRLCCDCEVAATRGNGGRTSFFRRIHLVVCHRRSSHSRRRRWPVEGRTCPCLVRPRASTVRLASGVRLFSLLGRTNPCVIITLVAVAKPIIIVVSSRSAYVHPPDRCHRNVTTASSKLFA